MLFSERRYLINGWNGKEYYLTAKQLWERVMKDSMSNYNWIASATELTKVCLNDDFPKEYAEMIKTAILNCFAELELKKEVPSRGESTDSEWVHYCYNSLTSDNRRIIEAKQKYLRAVIESVRKYYFELPIYHGPAYEKVCEEWVNSQFDDWKDQKDINFDILVKELKEDFGETIKKADEEGTFEEDMKKHQERMKSFLGEYKLTEKDFYL